jgi:gluconate 2-dehydrogenase gamma chain
VTGDLRSPRKLKGTIMAASGFNRRDLLAAAAVAGSTAAIGTPARSRSISGQVPWQPDQAAAPPQAVSATPPPTPFFTAAERSFIDAAVSRLIPADDLGPGAKEAGVTTFLDRQLAGGFGQGRTWYMQGPWADGTPSQGFQSRMTPAQIYRAAIKAVDEHCRRHFGSKPFVELSSEDQDKILTGLEKSEIELEGVKAKTFFDMLLQNTVEGFFCDPIYGGNVDMVGWKLIGFPGARYDYRDYVSRHGEKFSLPPVGLKGRPEWNPYS